MSEQPTKTPPRTSPGPFIVETASPLQLRPNCVCCGRPTSQTTVIKPTDPSNAGANFLIDGLAMVFHPLHFVTAIRMLKAPAVKLPMCNSCRFNHFLPGRKTVIYVVLLVLFFIDAFYHGFQSKFGYMLLDLLLAVICLVMVAKKNVRHDVNTLPVRVSLHNQKFRYTIYGGPLYDYFKKQS